MGTCLDKSYNLELFKKKQFEILELSHLGFHFDRRAKLQVVCIN